ncbi:DUF6151 family protein [Phenylobacterium sp.]|uniref:DUF6151 family protein n=1 Tax=Phenylobacterium sp. TaxID=1871053 RepID=UPI0035B1B015
MLHPLGCRCGALSGTVDTAQPHERITCYCADCQAYAHVLGHPEDLDARGGSNALLTSPSAIHIASGAERLASVRLSGRGPVRWYAACCDTPVANTGASPKMAFAALQAPVLGGAPALDAAFGPARLFGFVKTARGEPKPPQTPFVGVLLRVAARSLKARLDGSYRRTPFFDAATGRPVAAPRVLSPDERAGFVAAALRA